MPAIINPINMDEYKKERADQKTRTPEFTTKNRPEKRSGRIK
ncbi:hypothetical protein [Breznakiella homolactica]|nr:hypothetical protein [Breznakiella homolactica]